MTIQSYTNFMVWTGEAVGSAPCQLPLGVGVCNPLPLENPNTSHRFHQGPPSSSPKAKPPLLEA